MKELIIFSLLAVCSGLTRQRQFPSDFVFGTATASYQIEGAWDADGKGENIWDHMTHKNPEVIKDQSNGDIAADTYHNYKRDVEMMRELGIDMYRFSISWARILPNGFSNQISEAGVEFYNNYINITPMVTLYHWDLPQKLQDLGGFANPLMDGWFEDYARVVYAAFGDRVKHWITFNEPREVCYQGYGATTKAPILNSTGVGDYLCVKTLVLAHARAYRAYVDDFKPTQDGVCGITIAVPAYEADTSSGEDIVAAEMKKQGDWVIYAEPIFSEEGGFPKLISDRIAEKSKEQGYPRSRLPELTEDEKHYIKGTSDFFGVNHYSGIMVSANDYKLEHPVPSLNDDIDVGTYFPDDWIPAHSIWLKKMRDSIYKVLMDIHIRYNGPIIYVTENGWSTSPEASLEDDMRVTYYRDTLENCLDAIDDGVQLKGYMAWSLMDNFEWMQGYTERFGLYHVDFEDPMRTRTPRKSAFVYKQIVKTRRVDHDYQPDTSAMTIDEGH